MEQSLEVSTLGTQSSIVEAHWDHTFYGQTDELEEFELANLTHHTGGTSSAAGGLPVPINQHCILTHYAMSFTGLDPFAFGTVITVFVTRNTAVITSFNCTFNADGSLETCCDFFRDQMIYAPCDTFAVGAQALVFIPPIADVQLRVNLGFQLR